jgi:hypothetical protein
MASLADQPASSQALHPEAEAGANRPTPRLVPPLPADGASRGFYEQALPAGERALFRRARRERGLAGEIALLRLHLFHALHQAEGDGGLQMPPAGPRLIDLLIKALRAQAAEAENAGKGESEAARLRRWLEEEGALVLAEAGKVAEEGRKDR